MSKTTVNNKISVLVWGASSQAEIVTEILATSNKYQIETYVDDINIDMNGKHFHGKPILSSIPEIKEVIASGTRHAIIAIGNIKARKRLANVLIDLDFTFINAIHRKAIISNNVDLGFNTIIKAGAIIDPRVKIGDHSYIGAGVTIGHNTIVGSFVNISGGASIAGYVSIENEVFIGTGASIKDRVTIGDCSVISIGSAIVSDIPSNSVAKGVPAKSKSRT